MSGVIVSVAKNSQSVAPFIDGRFVQSESQSVIEIINPSNGQHSSTIPAGCEVDVDSAVHSARLAFDDGRWSEAPPSVRQRVLHRFADLIAANASALDLLDASEMGKPISVTYANAAAAANLMRFHAGAIDKINGDVYASDKPSLVLGRIVPRGVVAAVVPWNFPTYVAVLKIAPALAAGNCVVLKPSEFSSQSAIYLSQLGMEAGLPPGVLNVVPGLGQVVGRALALHMDVDLITFTGSTAVGRMMLQYAGQSNMKKVIAECGGKSPQIVFADGVDVDAAAKSVAGFLLTNQGQICSVGSRLLVQQSIAEAMAVRIAAHFREVVMGDACDPTTTFGPLVSARQCERVMDYIESACIDGATLSAGGKRALAETGGYFVEPTMFTNVSPKARISREEIFGPVLAVTPFEDESEAVSIANSTIYGLVAYVWTANVSTAMRMAKSIRSSVTVNAVVPTGEGGGHAATNEPYRQSGVGAEGGMAGMESYLRRQRVCFNHG